jgi:hypothetical protein
MSIASVSFKQILGAIEENATRVYSIVSPVVKHQAVVEVFKISRTIYEKTPKLLVPVKPKIILQQTCELSGCETLSFGESPNNESLIRCDKVTTRNSSLPSPDEEVYLLPPTRQIMTVKESPKETIVVKEPTMEPRKEIVVAKEPTMEPRKEIVVAKEPTMEPRKERGSVDPVCIGIEVRDTMYAIATPSVKQSIECEEARVIEGKLDELYKSQNGRSRGWIKTTLVEFIVPRAAAGGRVPFKQAFNWSAIWTDKKTSAALDFVCLAKGIRLAVWHEADKTVGIWPAADSGTNPPLFHVSSGGVPLNKKTLFEDGWTLRAPLSVEHALEKLSLSELDTLAEKLGTTVFGKKAERVRTLASTRMRLRFM